MKKLILSACILLLGFSPAFSQSPFHPFAGVGYGMENRIGFQGLALQGGVEFPFAGHLSASLGADYFQGFGVPGFGREENAGAYFRQITPALKIQYHSGAEPGTGLILSAGLGLRAGKTNHFETGDYHNGTFTNRVFVTENIRGKGFILTAGYGFPLSETLKGRIEISNHAFLMMNDQYTATFKVLF